MCSGRGRHWLYDQSRKQLKEQESEASTSTVNSKLTQLTGFAPWLAAPWLHSGRAEKGLVLYYSEKGGRGV